MNTKRILGALTLCAIAAGACKPVADDSCTLYVGTYGKYIHVLEYNHESGIIRETGIIPAADPSYLALGPQNSKGEKTLFCVSERGDESGAYSFACGEDGWYQTAYTRDIAADPCFIFPMPETGYVFTADYTGGALSVFSTEDGAINGKAQFNQYQSRYEGNPPVAGNQNGAHIHQVKEIPAAILSAAGAEGRFVLASDLGNDFIHVYKYVGGEPAVEELFTIECGPGAGPRHMEFNEKASLLYCLTELAGEVIVWKIAAEEGVPSFTEVQRLKADGFDAGGSADIHLHPSGQWLYTSHRLEGDGVSVMKVGEDGLLEKTSYTATGIHPRNFTFSPDGKKILVACRDSKSIEVYDINPEDGSLSEDHQDCFFESDRPVCLVFE